MDWIKTAKVSVVIAALGATLLPRNAAAQNNGLDIIWQASDNSDRVNTVNFSPDGTVLVAGSSDRLVNIFNAANGTLLETMDSNADKVHADSIECLAINPVNPAQICTVSSNLERLWNTNTATDVNLGQSGNWNVWCAFSPDGTYLATASFNDTIRVWKGTTLYKVFTTNSLQRTCAFSPDGKWLASGGGDCGVTIRSTSSWATVAVMTGHTNDIYDMVFSPDGTMLATGSYDNTARIWNVGSWTQKAVLVGSGPVYGVAFSPDSKTLAFTDGEGNHLMLANTSNGQITRTWSVDDVQCVAFSKQGLLGFGDVSDTTYVANVGVSGSGGTGTDAVAISSPANGGNYNSPANITLTATATSPNGVASVQFFYDATNSIGTDTAAPYSVSWTGVTAGTYSVTAVMTDKSGTTTTSAPVTISVGSSGSGDGSLKVAVTSPVNGARFLTQNITLSGTASANAAAVLVSVDGQPPQTASGTTRWSIDVTLNAGLNTIDVQSEDTSSNLSATVIRDYTYILSSPLTLVTNGAGRIVPYRPELIVGDKYTIEAIPAPGNVFNGWTDLNNNLLSDDAIYTFVMETNLGLQANFIPNPFIPVDGRYTGLINGNPPSAEGAGHINLALAPTGVFTATLNFDFTSFNVSGRFANDGSFTRTIPHGRNAAFDLSLMLDVSNGTDTVTGTISDGTVTSSILANRYAWNIRTNQDNVAGDYSLTIAPDTSAPNTPQGYGMGRAIIDKLGNVIASGRLADGSPFSEATFLSQTNSWPFFTWGGGQNIALGEITIDEQTNNSMNGVISWFRQPNAHSAIYAGGFDSTNGLTGAIDPPVSGTGGLSIGGTDTNGDNATVTLGGADFGSPLTFSGTIKAGRFLPDKSTGAPSHFSMAIGGSGIISGAFTDPNNGRPASFLGIVNQSQNAAYGYFLADGQSGYIVLTPDQ